LLLGVRKKGKKPEILPNPQKKIEKFARRRTLDITAFHETQCLQLQEN